MTRLFLLFLAGALSVAAYAPLHWFPLSFLCLALLFYAWLRAPSARAAALQGLVWGLGCFLTGVSWVYVSLHVVGGLPAPAAAAMTFSLCLLLSVFPAGAGALAWWLRHKNPSFRGSAVLILAASWTLNEWLRGHLFTGFPWLAIGYAQTSPSPLSSYAPVVGVYGLGFIVALIAAFLARIVLHRQHWRKPAECIVLVFVIGAGLRSVHWTTPTGKPFDVALLQGNVPQTLKWDPDHLKLSLDTYAELAQAHPASLVVLPETAIPLLFSETPKSYWQSLMAGKNGLLVGTAVVVREDGLQDRYANGGVLITPDLQGKAYFKRHLVPFGEYSPLGFRWFFDWVRIPMADFASGPDEQDLLSFNEQKISLNICYEDLFGEEIIRALPQATLLINLSNTAWFGDSLAQPQHLQIAQMRALETGRMMLRATNTGMTAAINPDGTVAAVLPPFSRNGIVVSAQGYSGLTPYVVMGNLPIILLTLLILGWAVFTRLRQRKA